MSEKIAAPLVAGPELDAIIASRVMGIAWDEKRCRVCGWNLSTDETGCRPNDCSFRPRPSWAPADKSLPYSTDIAAAFQIISAPEFMTGEFGVSRTASDEYYATYTGVLSGDTRNVDAYAQIAPLAICLAALTAVSQGSKEP